MARKNIKRPRLNSRKKRQLRIRKEQEEAKASLSNVGEALGASRTLPVPATSWKLPVPYGAYEFASK